MEKKNAYKKTRLISYFYFMLYTKHSLNLSKYVNVINRESNGRGIEPIINPLSFV